MQQNEYFQHYNSMKLKVPTSLDDISIEEYQRYMAIPLDATDKDRVSEILNIFYGIGEGYEITEKDKDELLSDLYKAFQNKGTFDMHIFRYYDEEYGVIPNFDKITTTEWNALSEFGKYEDEEKTQRLTNFRADTLHYLAAVLFRKVDKKSVESKWYSKSKDSYTIQPYYGTIDEAEAMKDLPMSKIVGIESFFLTLWQSLESTIQKFTEEEQAREMQH